MRTLKFKQTVNPVVELLNSQLDAAMQIIAALVLTDEEGQEISNSSDCKPDPQWIKSMREDILSDYMRPKLIQALKHQGFLTNTHAGFCVTPLLETPSNMRGLNKAYRTIEELAADFAAGKGEDTPDSDSKNFQEREKLQRNFWKDKLVARSIGPELAEYALRDQGSLLLCEAAMERIMRPIRAKKAAEETAAMVAAADPEQNVPKNEDVGDKLQRVQERLHAAWAGKQGIIAVAYSEEDWKIYVEMQHDRPDPVWMPEYVENLPIETHRHYPLKMSSKVVTAPDPELDEDDDY